jgi:hypothetical protein
VGNVPLFAKEISPWAGPYNSAAFFVSVVVGQPRRPNSFHPAHHARLLHTRVTDDDGSVHGFCTRCTLDLCMDFAARCTSRNTPYVIFFKSVYGLCGRCALDIVVPFSYSL